MKVTTKFVALIAISASVSHAATVDATNINTGVGDTIITGPGNTPMESGIAATGFFTTGFDPSSSLGDPSALITSFNVLASGELGNSSTSFGVDIGGFYESSATFTPGGEAPIGAEFFTMFGNGGDLAGSTQFALIRFPGLAVDEDVPTPDSNNANPSRVDFEVLIGSQGSTEIDLSPVLGAGNENASVNTVQLVPEPSVALLGLLGSLGLLRRRR